MLERKKGELFQNKKEDRTFFRPVLFRRQKKMRCKIVRDSIVYQYYIRITFKIIKCLKTQMRAPESQFKMLNDLCRENFLN